MAGWSDPIAGRVNSIESPDRPSFYNPFAGDHTARRTKLLYRYLPDGAMSVSDMAALANDRRTTDDQMVSQAHNTVRFAAANKYVRHSNRLKTGYDSESEAIKLQKEWEDLSHDERKQLRSLGLKEPFAEDIRSNYDDGGGIIGGIAKEIGDAKDRLLRNTVGSKYVEAGLHGLGVPQQTVMHGVRAGWLLTERAVGDVTGAPNRWQTDYLNEQDGHGIWAEIGAAWEDSGQAGGEGSYFDATRKEAYDRGGRDRTNFQLAYYQSIGMNKADAALKVAAKQLNLDLEDPDLRNNTEFSQAAAELFQRTDNSLVKDALHVLENGHMSPGRWTAKALFLKEGGRTDDLFNVVSGATDLTVTLFTDPLIVAGKIAKPLRGAQVLADASEGTSRIDRIMAPLRTGARTQDLGWGVRGQISKDLEERAARELPGDFMHADYARALQNSSLSRIEKMIVATADYGKSLSSEAERAAKFQREILPIGQDKWLHYVEQENRLQRALGPHQNLAEMNLDQVQPTIDRAIAIQDTEIANAFRELSPAAQAARRVVNPAQRATAEAVQAANRAEQVGALGRGMDTPEKVISWMESRRGTAALAEGAWDSSRFVRAQLPNLTRKAIIRNRVYARTALTVDNWRNAVPAYESMMEHLPFEYYDDIDKLRFNSAEVFGKTRARLKSVAGNAAFLASARTSNGVIRVMSPEGLVDFQSALRMGMGPDEMWRTWGQFATAPNAAARREVGRGAMEAMFSNLGLQETNKTLFNEWMHNAPGRFQRYSLKPGLAVMGEGNAQRETAIMLSQSADDVFLMPDFKTMWKASSQGQMHRMIEGTVNAPVADQFMEHIWKPMMILRIGFIPRVLADEVLPWVAREGLGKPLKQWFVMPFHKFTGESELPALLKPLAAVERRFRGWEWMDDGLRHNLGSDTWRANTRQSLTTATENTGVPVYLGDVFNQRGVNKFNKLAEAYGRTGGEIATRDAELLTTMPDAIWAKRFAAYSPDEIQFTKWVQARIQSATNVFVNADDVLALEMMRHNKVIYRAKAQEILTNRSGWIEAAPQTSSLDQLTTPVKYTNGKFVSVPMKADRTNMSVASSYDHAYNDMFDHQIHQAASSPEMRAGAEAFVTAQGPASTEGIGIALGAENPHRAILDIHRAYTDLRPGHRRLLNEALHTNNPAQRNFLLEGLEQQRGVAYPLKDLIGRYRTGQITDKQMSTLMANHDQLYRDLAPLHPGEPMIPSAPTVAEETAEGYTREEFRLALVQAKTQLAMDLDPASELYRQLGHAERKALESRVAHLEGRGQAVYDWARGSELDVAVHERRLVDAQDAFDAKLRASRARLAATMPEDAPVLSIYDDLLEAGRDPDELYDIASLLDYHIADTTDAALRGELAQTWGQLQSWQDAVARGSGTRTLLRSDDPEFIDALFEAHRELQTGVVADARKVITQSRDPALRDQIARRDDDIVAMIEGDQQALERVAKANIRHELLRPANTEGVQRLDRSRETATATGSQVSAPELVDGHARLFQPAMNPEDLRRAVAVLVEKPDKELEQLIQAVLEHKVGQDWEFNLDRYLATIDDEHAASKAIGAWATTDQALAEELSRKLYAKIGKEPLDGGIAYSDVPAEIAAQYSPKHLPETQSLLPHNRVGGFLPYRTGDYADSATIIDDQVRVAFEELKYMLTNGGREINDGAAAGIASGRPHPWHTRTATNVDQGLKPPEMFGPTRVYEKEGVWTRFARWGFDRVIGPMVDGVVRTPMFDQQFIRAVKEIHPQMRAMYTGRINDLANPVTRLFPGMDPEDVFRQTRSMHASMKGFYAVPDADILDPALRAAAHGREADLTVATLETVKNHPKLYLPPVYEEYLAKYELRAAAAPTAVERRAVTTAANAELRDVSHYYEAEKELFDEVSERAATVALDRTIPYVDDHRIRSQLSDVGRNIVPFYWAQEQTARRWISSIAQNPVFLREMQLALHGMRTMGVVRTDQFGDDIFVMPGAQVMQELLGRMPLIGPDVSRVATVIPLTGKVAYTVPFFQDMGQVSGGPLLTVPLKVTAEIFPEMQAVNNAILPEVSAKQPWYKDLLPPTAGRVLDTVMADPEADRELVSAQIQTIANMESNHIKLTHAVETAEDNVNRAIDSGDSDKIAEAQKAYDDALEKRNNDGVPGPKASDVQMDQFFERVQNQARLLLYTKAIYGFIGPTAPQTDLTRPFNDEYQSLLDSMPVDQAIKAFLKKHPDAAPYTVFPTTTESGASIPQTAPVDQWIEDNRQTIESYPLAAPWMAPRGDRDDPYFQKATANQLAMGLRQRVKVRDAYRMMKFKEAAPIYFEMQNDFETAIASEADQDRRSAMEDEWAAWRDNYFNAHPTFATDLRTPESQNQHKRIIDQMEHLVNDPRSAHFPDIDTAKELATQHAIFRSEMDAIASDRSGDAQDHKRYLRVAFINWGEQFIEDHPQFQALWHGVYEQQAQPRDLVLADIKSKRDGNLYDSTDEPRVKEPRSWSTRRSY